MNPESSVRKLNRIGRDALLMAIGGAILVGVLTRSWASTSGFLTGSILMIANFHFLWKFTQRVLGKETRNKTAYLAGVFLLFLIFLGLVAVALLVVKVPLIPFFFGTLTLVVSIILNGILLV